MAAKAFISGITGQDGAYLSRLLLEKGYEVHGGGRREGRDLSRLKHLGVSDDVQLHHFDLLNATECRSLLASIAPDEIYNLAAQSLVAGSFPRAVQTCQVNALGALHLLEFIKDEKASVNFFQASTSEMFGSARSARLDEDSVISPANPYAMAKAFAHWAVINYREEYGIQASSGILFNHDSPLRSENFVSRKISLGLARVKHGKAEKLSIGNLDVARDWGFAGDYVDAMWRMQQQTSKQDYVIATGTASTVRCFVETAAAVLGLALEWVGSGPAEKGVDARSGNVLVEVSSEHLRTRDAPIVVGNPSRAEQELGWTRQVAFPGLVEAMVESDERLIVDKLA